MGIALWLLVPVTALLACTDLREHRLPNWLNALAFVIAIVGAGFDRRAVVSGAVAFIVFLAIHLGTRGALGLGDVKLAPSLALVLGYINPSSMLDCLVLTFLTAGTLGGVLLAMGKITWKSRIPFGPFMIASFWIAVLSV